MRHFSTFMQAALLVRLVLPLMTVTDWQTMVPDCFRPERLAILVARRDEAVLYERADGRVRRVLEISGADASSAEIDSFGRVVARRASATLEQYTGLILLAEPRILGALRWALRPELSQRIMMSLSRADTPIVDSDIPRFFEEHAWLDETPTPRV